MYKRQGLVDPEVEVRPATHQVDDVLQEIHERVKLRERVLITTLTKRCLLYTSDAADERSSVDLGGRRIIKKKNSTRALKE